jgi:acyl dehydratase
MNAFGVGHRLEPVTYEITAERIAVYSRYVFDGRDTRNIHTDDEVARRAGLPRAVAQGRYPIGYMSERALAFFGRGWLEGGRLDVTLVKPIFAGDAITVCGTVVDRVPEDGATRVVLELWLENQAGERVTSGTASAVMPNAA